MHHRNHRHRWPDQRDDLLRPLVDADNFQLATTSTGAIAGSGIVLTSSSTAGPHTYTLSPLTIAGTFQLPGGRPPTTT